MQITIIGTGNMARGIGTRAVAGGHDVTVVGTEPEKAQALAGELGGSARAGERVEGDVVVLAVPYAAAADVVKTYGDQLDGKVVVDITNPVDLNTFEPLQVEGSGAQQIASAAASGASRRSTRRSPARSSWARSPASRSTCSSPATTRTPSARSPSSPRAAGCGPSPPGRSRGRASSRRSAICTWRSSSRSAPASARQSRSSRRRGEASLGRLGAGLGLGLREAAARVVALGARRARAGRDDALGLRGARDRLDGDEVGRLQGADVGGEVEVAEADRVVPDAVQPGRTGGPRVDHGDRPVARHVLAVVVAGKDRERAVLAAGAQRRREPLGESVLVHEDDVGATVEGVEPAQERAVGAL